MRIVREEGELRAAVGAYRAAGAAGAAGERIGFVPTMGALHDGHLSLVRLARSHAARVVGSVFVNPTQFGPGEDFERYPRQLERDAALLESAGCDLLFAPAVETMYPPGSSTFLDPAGPAEGLEGAHRPGHFRGVATVVSALFLLVQPDVAVFGEKDAQQLAVLRRMVRDLHFPIEIVPGPTLREADGLAMSSRNVYLDPDERRAAAVLHRALVRAQEAIAQGERSGDAVRRAMGAVLAGEPRARVEYAEVVDAGSFQPVETLRGALVLPMAVRIGKTRLIDNFQLTVPD
jgi:pantoate--beta-alanine ligase